MIDTEPRCWRCGKKLAEWLTWPWEIVCSRCHAKNAPEVLDKDAEDVTLKKTE